MIRELGVEASGIRCRFILHGLIELPHEYHNHLNSVRQHSPQ